MAWREGLRWLVSAVTVVMVATVTAATAPAETIRETVRIGDALTAVELRLSPAQGELRHRIVGKDPGAWQTIHINGVDAALILIADARLDALHALLEAWAGPGLERLRDATLERTRRAWQAGRASAPAADPAQGGVRGRVRGLLQYADALQSAGQMREATALLRAQRDLMPRKGDWDKAEWTMVSLALASAVHLEGDDKAAIALLRDTASAIPGSMYGLNAEASLAVFLAEGGDSSDALVQLDRTIRLMRGETRARDDVPGTQLQFDWIRACALHGSGRKEEAAALLAPFAGTPDPVSRRFVPPPNRDLEERAYLCTGDADALAALWHRDLMAAPIGSRTLLSVQPAYRSPFKQGPTLEQARRLFGAPPASVRMLDASFAPALRGWRM